MKKYEYRSKPKKCPKCISTRVATIYYGLPAFTKKLQSNIDAGKVVLGGCCLTEDDPKWQCADCGVDIYKKENPSEFGLL